jgi:hypothetical protein
MKPVSLESILGATHHHTYVIGVILTGVEVGVVPDEHRQAHFGVFSWEERDLLDGIGEATIFTKDSLQCLSQLDSVSFASLSKIV